ERVSGRFPFPAPMGCKARRRHASELDQFSHALEIDLAPVTLRFPRGKTDSVGSLIDALTDAIDPTKAQGFVQSLLVRDALFSRALVVHANPKFGNAGMILFKPGAKQRCRFEDFDFHIYRNKRVTLCALGRGVRFSRKLSRHAQGPPAHWRRCFLSPLPLRTLLCE